MKWSKSLFIGKSALANKFQFIKAINNKSFAPFLYLIILYKTELICVSSSEFYKHYYKKTNFMLNFLKAKKEDEVLILGFAKGRKEALSVLKNIVDEVYQKTGNFLYYEYFKELR